MCNKKDCKGCKGTDTNIITGGFQCREYELKLSKKDTLENRLKQYTNEIVELVVKKNKDYGNSFTKTVDEYGDVIYCIRLEDKLSRLKSLIKNKEVNIADESLEDTVRDVIGYSLLILNDMEDRKNGIKTT